MDKQTFIFFGPSGCGKGTQARMLIEKLKERDRATKVLYIETGQKFRDFTTESSFTAHETKRIIDEGGLLPEFLPIWIWTEYFVRHVSGNEHIVLDGLSRRAHEAPILDSAMKFYGRKNPVVISIELSDEVASERLRNRGRSDDNKIDIEARLKWYKENVVPAINYFRDNPNYKFISIDGSGAIEDVHKQILQATIGE